MVENFSSYSNFREVQTQSALIELSVSFSPPRIHSRVTYSMLVLSQSLSLVTLDTLSLQVIAASPGTFALGETSPHLGTPLHITLPEAVPQGTVFSLTVESECGESSPGLVWMTKAQTVGKQHPYVFTQFEPIYCRSVLPVQDVPSVKFPVEYRVTVPEPLKAVTAALYDSQESAHGRITYRSRMQYPIPAYLVAFAVGNIDSQDIGPRSKVYAEPEILESAAWEFAGTEAMLATAETIATPYEWGKYDILLLPPAFPYGGMENPTLTFMTPTVLAGDRSLVSIVAHEISHSWAGNLVTNKSWEHFWLNEGLTTYLENRIMRALLGDDATDVIVDNQLKSLRSLIDQLMPTHPDETRLWTVVGDRNPDDVYSIVPYYKGMCFFVHLETIVGGPSQLLSFLRAYFSRFAFESVDANDFKAYFLSHFPEATVDWEAWLHGEGMPPTVPAINLSVLPDVRALLGRFQSPEYVPSASDISGWSVPQLLLFLKLVIEAPLPQHLRMATAYSFSTTKNYEIKLCWLSIVVKLKATDHYEEVKDMLRSQGRMKYVRPLFALLVASGEREMAREAFNENKDFYSLILKRLLLKDMPWIED